MQGFRPVVGNPPGVPRSSGRHEVRARLPLSAPDTVPPPMLIEMEVDDPAETRGPVVVLDAASEARRQHTDGRHLALLVAVAAGVVFLAWAL